MARADAARTLALVLLAILPYLNGLHNEFVYDDDAQIVRNHLVRSLDPRPVLARGSVTQGHVHFYRPVTIYSFAVNYAAAHLRPFTYHVTNLLLHVANTWLVFNVGLEIIGAALPTFVGAALFAVHAVHTEAVTPIFGRADLLAALCVLAGLSWALGADRPTLRRRLAIAAVFVVGMLAKENAIVLPPAIVVLDLMRRGRRPVRATLADRRPLYATLLAACGIYLIIRVAALGGFTEANTATRYIENPLVEANPLVRIATALWVGVQYLRLFVWPWPLAADYSYRQIALVDQWSDPRLAAIVLTLALAVLLVAKLRAVWLAVVFLLLLAPISNVVFPIGTIMAERLLYLPSAALCLIVGVGVSRAARGPRWRMAVAGAIVAIALGANLWAAVARNRDWRSDDRLFAITAQASPDSAKAHFNYGSLLLDRGRTGEGEAQLRWAVAIAPVYPEAHNVLGTLDLAKGDLAAAEREFRSAVRDAPAYAPALANLGIVLRRQNQPAEAEQILRKAVDLDPTLATAYANLGLLAEQQRRPSDAVVYYRRAYELDPTLEVLRARAEVLAAGGTPR